MKKKVFLLISACVFIILTGIFSDIHLGDEVLHFRLARDIYYSGGWPLYDHMNQSFGDQKLYYVDPMLWHTILAFIWKIFFGISKVSAQVYQAAYFFIFIISTYIFSKKIYDEETASYTALLLITAPGVLLLSVIFHTDIPAVALAVLSIALMSKNRFFWAGVAAGLSFLIKRTAFIFIPGFLVFLIFFLKGKPKNKVISSFGFILPAVIFGYISQSYNSAALSLLNSSIDKSPLLMYCQNIGFYLKDIFDLKGNFLIVPAFLGVVIVVSAGLYFYYRAFSKRDIVLWVSLASFIAVYVLFFTKHISLRYSVIMLPFISLIAARGISGLKSKNSKKVIVIICLIQFFMTLGFVFSQRRINRGEKQAFEYIKNKTPLNSRFMCTRPDLQLYADRMTIWNNYLSLKELPCLFWAADTKQIKMILRKYRINYLLVEKDRIYNDAFDKHQLGWPESFIKKMATANCFNLEFENNRIALWKIKD